MKVVNCFHCGTPNVIQEHGLQNARCIKCGNYVQASATIFSMLPKRVLFWFCLIGCALFLGALILLLLPCLMDTGQVIEWH